MSSVDALQNTLIWAAGGVCAPEFDQIKEEDLLLAVRWHRLESRFLHRARTAGVTLPSGLADQLTRRHQEQRELIRKQAELYAELRGALQSLSPGAGVALVKGFGLYALTQADEHVRYSVDLDVIGSDPAEVARAALTVNGVGYHHHGEDHPYVFAHMRDIEVHSRYLVTGFPAHEPSAEFEVAANPGIMHIRRPFSVSAIEYPAVARNLVDTPLGPVPSPELALLVRCAHIYVGFAMDPFPLTVATVRLDELAQVMDLVSLDGFDAKRFQALCGEFDADLVVSFARVLCRELLGTDPFDVVGQASAPGPVTRTWFPQNLWWDGIGAGFPVRLEWSPRDLVARALDWPGFVAALSPTTLSVDHQQRARVSFLSTGTDQASRYFWHAFQGDIGPVDTVFSLSAYGIQTIVTLPATDDNQMSMVGLAFGDSRVELFFKPRENTSEFSDYSFPRLPAGTARGSGHLAGKQHVLTVDLPWAAFGMEGPPTRGQAVGLVLRARQQIRPWQDVAGGVVAPLLICC